VEGMSSVYKFAHSLIIQSDSSWNVRVATNVKNLDKVC